MSEQPSGIDPGVVGLAARVFGLARSGAAEQPAAFHGHRGGVTALLDRGADPGRVNDRGQTSLAAAVFEQSEETVGVLLAAGADPDAGGPTARETAAFVGLPAMTALLDGARP